MKKVLSVILVLLLILCPVSFIFASAQDCSSISVTVASDIHFYSKNHVGDMSKSEKYDENDPYYNATTQGQMGDISESIIREFLDEFVESDSEYLLIPGDLTQGFISDHQELSALLEDTIKTAAELGKTKKIYVINGNHDIVSGNFEKINTADEFKAVYNSFGYADALSVDPTSCSYSVDLDDNYLLISLDSCEYGKDDGLITSDRMNWLTEQTKYASENNKHIIMMMHHSVVPHFSVQPMSDDYENWIKSFSELGIKYVLTGHMHANDISSTVADNGQVIYDIMTGSLITSPDAYRVITYSDKSVDITTEYVTSVKEEYPPEGISDSMRSLIVSDFPFYAENFFREGMSRWIYKYIGTPYKVARLLKINEQSAAYSALASVMGCLGDALHLPLYNSESNPDAFDSFEEICSAYGYSLPESDYSVAGDVVAAVMSALYAGDENITSDSDEIKILYSVLSAGIVYSAVKLNSVGNDSVVDTFFKAVGVRTDILTSTKIGTVFAGKKAADALMGSILSSLFEGVSSDIYGPSDLNVSLPGYSETASQGDYAPASLIGRIMSIIKNILKAFANCFSLFSVVGC